MRFAPSAGRVLRTSALVSVALLAIGALLSGCSNGPGPLGDGGGSLQCAPARPAHWVSDGDYALENHSSSAVTISSVRLAQPSHLRMMTKAWLVPVYTNHAGTHLLGVGVGFPWPPTAVTPTWAKRRQAVGAVIKPGETIALAFAVRRTSAASPGRSAGALVAYSADGSTFTVVEGPAVVLGGKC